MYNSSSFVLAGAVWSFFGQMICRMEYSPVSLGTLLMTVIVNSCLTWPISFIQLFNGIPFRYGGSILLPLGTLLVIALIDLFLTLPTLLIQVFCGIPIRSYVGTFSFCYLHAALLVCFTSSWPEIWSYTCKPPFGLDFPLPVGLELHEFSFLYRCVVDGSGIWAYQSVADIVHPPTQIVVGLWFSLACFRLENWLTDPPCNNNIPNQVACLLVQRPRGVRLAGRLMVQGVLWKWPWLCNFPSFGTLLD